MSLRGWRSAALPAAVILFALAVNHDAYRGFFEDDDLATFTWARWVPPANLLRDIPLLRFEQLSRPLGFFYFGELVHRLGFTYPPYLAIMQALAALNVALLWFVLRRLGLEPVACAAGCLFFAVHRALFDAWWKPMFVYDVLCTTFALLSILAYAWRQWVLSFIAFWLAMRTKEIGIVVPVILLGYEMMLGGKKWLRTLPFFLPAIIYGGYGLAYNLRQHSLYGFRFTLPALWKAAVYYSSKLLWIPYAGFALLLLPLAIRDRRLYFGLTAMLLGVSIYLLLPEKMYEVYLYFAVAGAGIAIAVLARERPAAVWGVLAIWIGWQVWQIRQHAAVTLGDADDRRAFFAAARGVPDSPMYAYDVVPASMHSWGVEASIVLQHSGDPKVFSLVAPGLPADNSMLLLSWDARSRRLAAMPFSPVSATYLHGDEPIPPWQLLAGWQPAMNGYRAIARRATARLYRPEHTDNFVWEACASGPVELRTFIEGQEFPEINFKGTECVHGQGRMESGQAGVVTLDFLVGPENAVKIGSFGFVR